MQPWDVISTLEADNSRLAKEAIIEAEMLAGNNQLFAGIRLCLDSLVTFGVKKVPEHAGTDGAGLSWLEFVALTTLLEIRELTGNEARDAILEACERSTQAQWDNWYRRILIKDLRCGVSEKTVNAVAKKCKLDQYAVPVFSCQLAQDSANHDSKMTGKKLVSIKLDGVRVLTIVYPNGTVNQYSRNGKELVNFEHIKTQFASVAADLEQAYVFDGEIMSSSFQDLMRQVHRKSNVSAQDAMLYLFDIVPLVDFQKGICKLSQDFRSNMLANWFEQVETSLPGVRVLEQELVDLSTKSGRQHFEEINREAITGGHEGLMIKEPSAPYECKRTVSWMKLKPYLEASLTAVAVEAGTGKNAGRMGAVLFEGVDDGKLIQVSVGSGWSDADRDAIWANQKRILGQVAEIRADAVTLSQNSDSVYSLRFPRFKTWRGFDSGEKI
jgi:DNA ligase-1